MKKKGVTPYRPRKPITYKSPQSGSKNISKATSQQATSQQATSQQATSQQATSQQATSQQVTSQQVTSQQIASQQALSSTSALATSQAPQRKTRPQNVAIGVILVAVLIVVGVVLMLKTLRRNDNLGQHPRYVSPIKMGTFKNWIVVTGTKQCIHVPRKIFAKNGTVGDAAVATMLCSCVVMPHRCGLGGGFFAIYYNRKEKKTHAINSREKAPTEAPRDMFVGEENALLSLYGGKAVGAFGVLRGYGMILNTTGHNVPWKDLFEDAIKYAKEGFEVYDDIHNDIVDLQQQIRMDSVATKILLKTKNCPPSERNCPLDVGDTLKNEVLSETLKTISSKDWDALNSPPWSNILAEDISKRVGIMKASDLENFEPVLDPPITLALPGGLQLHTMPLPAGGTTLSYIANIISQFVIDGRLPDDEHTAHIFVEAFKFGFASRPALGDPMSADFSTQQRQEIMKWVRTMTSTAYAKKIKDRIQEETVDDANYYGLGSTGKHDHGTGELIIVAPNGDVISMVGSINTPFGALVVSPRTGIWMNNVMDDFSTENQENIYGLIASEKNYIWGGKRPLSSLAPSIVVDSKGDFVLAITSTGSSTTTTATAQVLARILWMGQTVKEAVDSWRIHNQLHPDVVMYDNRTDAEIVSGLQRRKHRVKPFKSDADVVAVARDRRNQVYNGSADFRLTNMAGVDGG
ncbi:scoloptoxin SSD14-like isoform X2 [Ornithodoros turicata]|uniref:scoloptoxin SSD14-like isoform X2 n=1 Tax=Ornithodoros turicata TaxID=34597 RepID=UPI00313939A1